MIVTTVDKMSRKEGRVIKFGAAQLSNPTPGIAKIVFRIILYLSGLWAVVSPLATQIPAETLADINQWLLIGNAAINITIKFWGWDFENQ